jgi:hypothetical protein
VGHQSDLKAAQQSVTMGLYHKTKYGRNLRISTIRGHKH